MYLKDVAPVSPNEQWSDSDIEFLRSQIADREVRMIAYDIEDGVCGAGIFIEEIDKDNNINNLMVKTGHAESTGYR